MFMLIVIVLFLRSNLLKYNKLLYNPVHQIVIFVFGLCSFSND